MNPGPGILLYIILAGVKNISTASDSKNNEKVGENTTKVVGSITGSFFCNRSNCDYECSFSYLQAENQASPKIYICTVCTSIYTFVAIILL